MDTVRGSAMARRKWLPPGALQVEPVLLGRAAECARLRQLIDGVRGGGSRSLVISGEPGVGKSALLDYLVAQAAGCEVIRVAGVPAETHLAIAGLHRLCRPLLHRLENIPAPQREALATAFGLRSGPAPDRFLLGLAVLNLLADAAAERPLVCVVDDSQWLDGTSVGALAFAARRLVADAVALVFAIRDDVDDQHLADLPRLKLDGLPVEDARALLAAAIPGPLDEGVRDRIVAETRGNPLALLELPTGLTYAELAGGFGLLDARTLPERIEASFRDRMATLPLSTRRMLLVAAVEATGEPQLVHRAAVRLGVDVEITDPTVFAGLLQWGQRLTFRHPLARSAVYRAAPPEQRRRVHRALADVIDPGVDPDRRAWHLAHSTGEPDEHVAAQLERSAGRARERGGLAAAAAFLHRAAELTPSGERRGLRILAAAEAQLEIGAFDATISLLAAAEQEPLDDGQRTRIDLLRAQLAFASSRGNEAAPLLLAAARRLEPLDSVLARDTYLDAIAAAMFAGRLSCATGVREVAAAAREAPARRMSDQGDLLLEALAGRFSGGYVSAVPLAKRAVRAFGNELDVESDVLRWSWLAAALAADQWDHESWQLIARRYVLVARRAGALTQLPLALNSHTVVDIFAGDLAGAAELVDEADAVTEMTGTGLTPYGALWLAAWRGREQEARRLRDAALAGATARGEGIGLTVTHAASALLANAQGDYARASAEARQASDFGNELAAPGWGLYELIEASARLGDAGSAAEAFARLSPMLQASATGWALGVDARARALVTHHDGAEGLYREAIDLLGRTRVRAELARARLLYGEWLRRRRRRLDAREQLRSALEAFTTMGAEAFAERARRELLATGEKVRRRPVAAAEELTAQQAQIARMARRGLSNPEIGGELFLSPRTVEWHLGKIFTKLGISSRHQLDRFSL